MRRYLGSLVLAAVVLVALWFLQQRDDAPPAPSQPSATSSAPTAAAPAPATPTPAATTPMSSSPPEAPAVNPVEPEGDPVDPTAPATARDEDQAKQFTAYAKAAEAFMADFARAAATVTEQQWWSKVSGHLSEQAVTAYEGTDPQNVPFTAVTGPATIVPSDAPTQLLAIARVPTDSGWYRVEMTTTADGIRITRASPESGGQR
jgi:type IV secretory pathway VirB10-like protein